MISTHWPITNASISNVAVPESDDQRSGLRVRGIAVVELRCYLHCEREVFRSSRSRSGIGGEDASIHGEKINSSCMRYPNDSGYLMHISCSRTTSPS